MQSFSDQLATLTIDIHASNVKAGWWENLETGMTTLHTRNRPEMLMLAVSEVAEAVEGIDGRMDDKLPHLPMFDVELADFVIRQLDQIGAEVACGHAMPDWEMSISTAVLERSKRSPTRELMAIMVVVARAMEEYRKGRIQSYIETMAFGVALVFDIATFEGIDLLNVIAQKRAFNARRADHKPENRTKEGGKAF